MEGAEGVARISDESSVVFPNPLLWGNVGNDKLASDGRDVFLQAGAYLMNMTA